jgi:hypothetical protein
VTFAAWLYHYLWRPTASKQAARDGAPLLLSLGPAGHRAPTLLHNSPAPRPPYPQDDDASGRIASIGSLTSGILFASAWYLFWGSLLQAHTDCIIWGPHDNTANCTAPWAPPGSPEPEHTLRAPENLVSGAYWAPGILSTFGLIGLNLISWEAVVGDDEAVGPFARVWVTISLIFMFTGLGVALWCLITDLQTEGAWHWSGICVFVQNVLILTAGFLFRIVRRSGDHSI